MDSEGEYTVMDSGDWQEEDTQVSGTSGSGTSFCSEEVPGLTILAHADPRRVGERLSLLTLAAGLEVLLSRLEPKFRAPRAVNAHPLAERSMSRQPIRLLGIGEPAAVMIDVTGSPTAVVANGDLIAHRRLFSATDIERGVVLRVGQRVVLLLHHMPINPLEGEPGFGLVGESTVIVRLRREIRRLASLDVSVLLRGETGTGKELVARALHEASRRRQRPFVAVNMSALPPSLAASELFGAARGAYTGADRAKVGFFQHAQKGTLFLDEIGETPSEVQPMLLRVLESHEILPVGSVEAAVLDARVIAATDTDLDDAIRDGRFRAPLLHRLAGYPISLPPLRERRDDIGRLLFSFLSDETSVSGVERFLPPAKIVARLARYDWPGNVRELRNVARWLAITGRACTPYELTARLEELLAAPTAKPARFVASTHRQVDPPELTLPATAMPAMTLPTRRHLRKLNEVGDEELLTSLRAHRWQVKAAAETLGVSRANLYRLIELCPAIRKAVDLGSEEIRNALTDSSHDLESTASRLEVSLRGLKRRMAFLGIAQR